MYLVHPWIDFLLDRQPVGSGYVEQTVFEDEQSSIRELPSPGPSDVTQAISQTRTARLAARLGRQFGGRPPTSPDAASLRPPSSVSQADKQVHALQVLARLRRPFGALLLAPHPGYVAAYRRVAAESLIVVQIEEITPAILNKLIESVRTVDVI
ncbi:hypothetical protein OG21DRAFT_1490030 [Imleria badia]|nr:hypothetical protein OG21DRAFT_1490030 [Imleria badia]